MSGRQAGGDRRRHARVRDAAEGGGRGGGRGRGRRPGRAAARLRRDAEFPRRLHVRARLLGLGVVARAARHHQTGDGRAPLPLRGAARDGAVRRRGDGVHVALLGVEVGRARDGGVRRRARGSRGVDRYVRGARGRGGNAAARSAALTARLPLALAARRCASGRATAPTWTFEASSAAARP